MINNPLIKKISLFVFMIILFTPTFSITSSFNKFNLQIDSTKKDNIQFNDKISTKDESVGNEEVFWVKNYPSGDYQQVIARLLVVGQHCYIYVDLISIASMGESYATNKSITIANEFDSTMWSTDLALIGHPDGTLGDIDGDPKITILLANCGYGGNYDFKDENPSHPYSNQREMVYMHPELTFYQSFITLIHEFNHLIHLVHY